MVLHLTPKNLPRPALGPTSVPASLLRLCPRPQLSGPSPCCTGPRQARPCPRAFAQLSSHLGFCFPQYPWTHSACPSSSCSGLCHLLREAAPPSSLLNGFVSQVWSLILPLLPAGVGAPHFDFHQPRPHGGLGPEEGHSQLRAATAMVPAQLGLLLRVRPGHGAVRRGVRVSRRARGAAGGGGGALAGGPMADLQAINDFKATPFVSSAVQSSQAWAPSCCPSSVISAWERESQHRLSKTANAPHPMGLLITTVNECGCTWSNCTARVGPWTPAFFSFLPSFLPSFPFFLFFFLFPSFFSFLPSFLPFFFFLSFSFPSFLNPPFHFNASTVHVKLFSLTCKTSSRGLHCE